MLLKSFLLIILIAMTGCNPYGKGTEVKVPESSNGDNGGGPTGGNGDYTRFGDGSDGDVTLTANLYSVNAIPGSSKRWGTNARVQSIAGNNITLSGSPPGNDLFAVNDEIMWHVSSASANCSTDSSLYLGASGFAKITAKAGTTLTLDQSITANPNNTNLAAGGALSDGMGNYCTLQIVRVANFNNVTVNNNVNIIENPLSAATGLGGIGVIRVAGTLTVNGGNTFTIGDRFVADGTTVGAGMPPANNRNAQGPAATGMGITACNTSGCGAELANVAGGGRGLWGGGPNYFGGGGGAAHLGAGGRGGSPAAGPDYGRGGNTITCGGSECIFIGSSGGGGATGAVGSNSTYGGGVFIAYIRNINGNVTINANGLDAPDQVTYAGGGGASGGTVKLYVENVQSGTVQVLANGGDGANSDLGYGGGGGGGGLAYAENCTGTITAVANGGAAGSSGAAGAENATAGSAGIATVDTKVTHTFCPP